MKFLAAARRHEAYAKACPKYLSGGLAYEKTI